MTKQVGEREVPVTEIELDYGISAGIHLQSIGTDMVPLQEEHDARLERGIDLNTWCGMDVLEKALIVAHRRNRIAIQNLHTEAEIRKAERDAKKH